MTTDEASDERANADRSAELALQLTSKTSSVLTLLSVVLIAGSLFWSYERLRREASEAARLQTQINDKKAQLAALESRANLLQGQTRGLTAALNAVVSSNGGAATALNIAAETNKSIAVTVPRIFLHTNGNNNQELIQQVANVLRGKGFIVVGPDSVRNNADPSYLQIRFFADDDVAHTDAQTIKNALDSVGLENTFHYYQFDNTHTHPPRTYTVYLPRTL